MAQVFSEINKVVNVVSPFLHAGATAYTSDIVNMENYKKCTFIIQVGLGAAATPGVLVYSGLTSTGAATATAFKYRTQVAVAPPGVGSDMPITLTDATTTGFALTTATTGAVYIVEVDAAVVASALAGADHCAIAMTTGALGADLTYGILAILSEPRYPQDILATAID
ncbi:MAG TPA: hypothetical protein VMV86_06200 [Methanosarcinales archaeon]|nr:hypothetical protein [Methanosarcinales archaeon]